MMKSIRCIILAAAAVLCINADYAASAPGTPDVHPEANRPDFRLVERNQPAFVMSPIINVSPGNCCGGSMSSSARCVSFTLRNKTNAPATYTTEFRGSKAGECIKYEDQTCAPGMICPPKCVESAPPIDVIVPGPDVTVPPLSAGKEFSIRLNGSNNTFYLAGATIQVTANGKTFTSSPLPSMSQCVQ